VQAPATAPPAVAAVLLDYGGTLDGDAAHWFDHFVELYGRLGRPLPVATLKPAFYAADAALAVEPGVRAYGLDAMVRAHVERQLAALGIADPGFGHALAAAFSADTRRAWDRNRPMLRRLAARVRLGVVSNSYGNMPTLLAEAALAPFDPIVDSALVGVAKPDRAIFDLARRRLDLPAGAILHVGDSWERDVVPARAAGMQVAWLAPLAAEAPEPGAAVWRLASLLDLEALLA
jgi:putative hydrolase of the HAD superfamily